MAMRVRWFGGRDDAVQIRGEYWEVGDLALTFGEFYSTLDFSGMRLVENRA